MVVTRNSPIQKCRDQLISIKTEKLFRMHVPIYITISTTTRMMRQGLEDKCEVVGQGSFASPNTCCLSTVIRVCNGTVAVNSNADVIIPVAWPATVTCHLCLHLP